jgi:hypothetical protein
VPAAEGDGLEPQRPEAGEVEQRGDVPAVEGRLVPTCPSDRDVRRHGEGHERCPLAHLKDAVVAQEEAGGEGFGARGELLGPVLRQTAIGR